MVATTNEPMMVAGPMHPDMFDSSTPMMVPAPHDLSVYRVTATWWEPERATYEIAAASHDEAERIASDKADRAAFDAADIDIEECIRLDQSVPPDLVDEWKTRQENKNA